MRKRGHHVNMNMNIGPLEIKSKPPCTTWKHASLADPWCFIAIVVVVIDNINTIVIQLH